MECSKLVVACPDASCSTHRTKCRHKNVNFSLHQKNAWIYITPWLLSTSLLQVPSISTFTYSLKSAASIHSLKYVYLSLVSSISAPNLKWRQRKSATQSWSLMPNHRSLCRNAPDSCQLRGHLGHVEEHLRPSCLVGLKTWRKLFYCWRYCRWLGGDEFPFQFLETSKLIQLVCEKRTGREVKHIFTKPMFGVNLMSISNAQFIATWRRPHPKGTSKYFLNFDVIEIWFTDDGCQWWLYPSVLSKFMRWWKGIPTNISINCVLFHLKR